MRSTTPVLARPWPGGPPEEDLVVTEEPLELRVEGRPLVVTMRTPGHDEELAAGLLYAEGLIDGPDDIAAMAKVREPLAPRDNTLDLLLASGLRLDASRLTSAPRNLYASSACGLCGQATLDHVLRRAPPLRDPLRLDPALAAALPERMREAQVDFARTGGLHAAALFSLDGHLEVLREDVGRHNAVDKVLGWRLLRDAVPVDDRALVTSGRAGFEIVQKALAARVPALVSVGAPTSLAVQLAARAGMQLLGFARGGRAKEYLGAREG